MVPCPSLNTAYAFRRATSSVDATSGPALVRSVALECVERAFSQLLTGARPRGCPDAARVFSVCDWTLGRRASSRLTNAWRNAVKRTR